MFSGSPHLQLLCCNSTCVHRLSVLQPKPALLFGLWTSRLLSLSFAFFWSGVLSGAMPEVLPEVLPEVVGVAVLLFGQMNLILTHKKHKLKLSSSCSPRDTSFQ